MAPCSCERPLVHGPNWQPRSRLLPRANHPSAWDNIAKDNTMLPGEEVRTRDGAHRALSTPSMSSGAMTGWQDQTDENKHHCRSPCLRRERRHAGRRRSAGLGGCANAAGHGGARAQGGRHRDTGDHRPVPRPGERRPARDALRSQRRYLRRPQPSAARREGHGRGSHRDPGREPAPGHLRALRMGRRRVRRHPVALRRARHHRRSALPGRRGQATAGLLVTIHGLPPHHRPPLPTHPFVAAFRC